MFQCPLNPNIYFSFYIFLGLDDPVSFIGFMTYYSLGFVPCVFPLLLPSILNQPLLLGFPCGCRNGRPLKGSGKAYDGIICTCSSGQGLKTSHGCIPTTLKQSHKYTVMPTEVKASGTPLTDGFSLHMLTVSTDFHILLF